MFESVQPAGTLEDSEQDVAVEQMKKRIVERQPEGSRLKRAAQVLAILAASFLSNAQMSANEGSHTEGPTTQPSIESVESEVTVEQALQKIDDPKFVESVKNIMKQLDQAGDAPKGNVVYDESEIFKTLDNSANCVNKKNGQLPRSAKDVVIKNHGTLLGANKSSAEGDKSSYVHFRGLKEDFSITKSDKPIEEAGEMTMEGQGRTEEDAIVNALKSASDFAGEDIESKDTGSHKTVDDGGNVSTSRELTELIKTGSEHAVKGFEVVDMSYEEAPIGITCKAKVRIQFGVLAQDNAKK